LGWRGGRQDIDRRTAQTQPPGKFIQPVAPARDDDQVVAIVREALGKGLADTGRGAGHERAWACWRCCRSMSCLSHLLTTHRRGALITYFRSLRCHRLTVKRQ
jgi:hypothetical protein